MMDWTPPPPLACSLTPIHAPTPSYVQKLERQVNASAKQHREEVNKLTERVEDLIKQQAEALLDFQKRCNTLVGDVNAFARLLEEEWK